jgi:hypothetical protein
MAAEGPEDDLHQEVSTAAQWHRTVDTLRTEARSLERTEADRRTDSPEAPLAVRDTLLAALWLACKKKLRSHKPSDQEAMLSKISQRSQRRP